MADSKVDTMKAAVSEFVAMLLFVFVGCGTAVSSQAVDGFNSATALDNTFLTAVSLAFGIGIAVLVYTIAPISGGHINPAVTLSFVAIGQMDIVTGLIYFVAQFLGAMIGAAILWGCTNSDTLKDGDLPPYLLGSNFVSSDYPVGSAFLIEVMGTFLLVWTVMMTAVYPKNMASNIAPIAIGWSVLLAHLVLIPFTGCGINPARSFGPHIISIFAGGKVGEAGWWVYYTAPFVGGVLAALLCKFLYGLDDAEEAAAEEKPEAPEGEAKEGTSYL